MKTKTEQLLGFLNINKPGGITSHDVVNAVRRRSGMKHVGHGGTLDPMALGVLPIAVGAACRLIRFLPPGKTYVAGVLLGRQTNTDDITGDIVKECIDTPPFDAPLLLAELQKFVGEIEQVPPLFSAIHVNGKRSYELARAGQTDVEIAPRQVTINSVELLQYNHPEILLRIDCSTGTYIRSIARDLGARLGCGATMSSLVRERSGIFNLSEAVDLNEFRNQADWETFLVPPLNLLSRDSRIVHREIDRGTVLHVRQGKALSTDGCGIDPGAADGDLIMLSCENELVAMCLKLGQQVKPEVVIGHATS